ncbi:chemotaxis protein CheA [Bacillus sp. B-jedd]|uniref:chemotaxis protein CheA n=1 Tax=Bacillus sp. B-jedd TaxID=1476857 RepID=UPI0005155FFC|nr:chemotaxis protein CheA [Bacillus sp. B-jedd]CEG25872.1 chemotactic two-component sensor histidine kinase [Bacillus sp. B-jedd]
MANHTVDEAILEAYILEFSQLTEQLELIILSCERAGDYSAETVNDIFRIMHTIKGSSSMMAYNTIACLAHVLEDLFSFLRQETLRMEDYSKISDLMLSGIDFMKVELEKIRNGDSADGNAEELVQEAEKYLDILKMKRRKKQDHLLPDDMVDGGMAGNSLTVAEGLNRYEAVIMLEDCSGMENVRAYQIIQRFKEDIHGITYEPAGLESDFSTAALIKEQGFRLFIQTEKSFEEVGNLFNFVTYVQSFELKEIEIQAAQKLADQSAGLSGAHGNKQEKESRKNGHSSSFISVNVTKLDELMDMVGELVIAEAMVTQHPEIVGLELEQFTKAARHLRKITSEIQDKVMSIRMLPLSGTFKKMNRIVRDMGKKLNKSVELRLIGEETEVDKNIIEHISDPIMHIVRNAIDHGIESREERAESGKPETGMLTLEARNAGNEVWIIIRDDGQGLHKEKLLQKARERSLLNKKESGLTDSEIYNLILLPGFSTKEAVTEYSGRGVGLDVVAKNIHAVGGTVAIESEAGKGTGIIIKIPLTLAIIDGMNVKVGDSFFTISTTQIKESFRPESREIIRDPNGSEMIMVRGICYPIIRLHERLGIQTEINQIENGILIMSEYQGGFVCIFADRLIGQQQVVLKPLPRYIKEFSNVSGISGCTLLGDGNISLILDVAGLARGKENERERGVFHE